MYKIKLLQSIELKITVPKGAKSGEITGKFIDDQGIISRNREEIISSTLSMETMIDDIISNLFFDQYSDSGLFKEIFLTQEGVSFHTKERVLSRLLEAKRIYDNNNNRTELITKIAKIKETRNHFAHGKIYFDQHGAYLKYYKDGLKSQKLDDNYWKEVENNFNTTFQLLSELSKKSTQRK